MEFSTKHRTSFTSKHLQNSHTPLLLIPYESHGCTIHLPPPPNHTRNNNNNCYTTRLRFVHDRVHRTQRSHVVHVLAEIAILDVRMFDLAMGLHVVASRELLAAHRTLVALRPMDVGMVPAIRNGLVAADATVQRRKRAGQLHKQRRVVDVVVTSRRGSGGGGGSCGGNRCR